MAKGGTTYRTSEIAKLIGVHPNTIRFYEDVGLLPEISRLPNGYRVFDSSHVEQLKLLRVAFRSEITSSRLRQEAFEIVKTAAKGDKEGAYRMAIMYLEHLKTEEDGAWEAIKITKQMLNTGMHLRKTEEFNTFTGRKDMAEMLGISIDVLRDWERNGLISVPRNKKGERVYRNREISRLKIIRTLRNANYSMMSILRMLTRLDNGDTDVLRAIDTPGEEENIVGAADRYITALGAAQEDVKIMLGMLNCNF